MQKSLATLLVIIFGTFMVIHPAFAADQYEISDTRVKGLFHLEDVADSSGGGFNMTNNNGATFGTAKLNNGVDFGAANTNKYLEVENTLGIVGDQSMSFSAWVAVTSTPSSGNTYQLFFKEENTNDTRFYIGYNNDGGTLKLANVRVKPGAAGS